MLSGLVSFGGVGGKLNELDVAIDVGGCTDSGAVGLGCVRDLLKGFIQLGLECAITGLLSASHG